MKEFYDVIILGAGPAGLQAAIHAARRRVSVLVIGKIRKSSIYSAHIENFCCLDGKNGEDMLRQASSVAEKAGAKFLNEDVINLSGNNHLFEVTSESDKQFEAAVIIIAMGIERNTLGLKNEKSLVGKGISYCVDCDGSFFSGEKVAIIGCESAAISGALTLLFYASEVHLICPSLDVSGYLMDKLIESDIHLHKGRKIKEIIGESAVTGLVMDDDSRIDVSGVFIELGAKGAINLAGKLGVMLDPESIKYIRVNNKQETNVPGIYAAGDICGPPWQVAKAVGEGCVAGLEAAAHAKKYRPSH
jgi:thioredoxin reductase (NADPH)